MKSRSRTEVPVPKASTRCVSGSCLCGAVKIEIGREYALKDVRKAHEDLEAGETVGSQLLIP